MSKSISRLSFGCQLLNFLNLPWTQPHSDGKKDYHEKQMVPILFLTIQQLHQAPGYILDLVKCSWLTSKPCSTMKCKCRSNNTSCTIMCKCNKDKKKCNPPLQSLGIFGKKWFRRWGCFGGLMLIFGMLNYYLQNYGIILLLYQISIIIQPT